MNFEEIVGASPALRQALNQVDTVAPTGSTVQAARKAQHLDLD